MPPRPALRAKQSRPVSAVFLGKGGQGGLSQSPQLSSSLDGGLPDLPEPPSPSSSIGSIKSGLPSPPATNSTGSGSTGDPATIALRERPLSLHSSSSGASTSSGSHQTAPVPSTPMKRSTNDLGSSSRSSSRAGDISADDSAADADFDDDYDKENDNDNDLEGDDTARLDRRLLATRSSDHPKPKSSSENLIALHRARSLAQRNKLTLEKLTRLGSPSPARSGTPNSRSPVPSHTSSSRLSNSSSSRQVRALPQVPPQDHVRSGSETERESTTQHSHNSSTHSSHSSSSNSNSNTRSTSSINRSVSYTEESPRPSTPPSQTTNPLTNPNLNTSPYNRLRHISAPASPNKARLIAAANTSGGASSSGRASPSTMLRRNRASMASVSQLQLTDFEEEDPEDAGLKTITNEGTARLRERTLNERDKISQRAQIQNTSRRSPVGQRKRAALPREFRSDLTSRAADDSPPAGRRSVAGSRHEDGKDDRRESWQTLNDPVTPFRTTANGLNRSSTVRERRSGVSPRWSEDLRSSATVREHHASLSTEDGLAEAEARRRERKQSLRGGSAESALGMWSPGGSRLLGEGLRAAGLTWRKDDDPRGRRNSGDLLKEKGRMIDWSPQDVIDGGGRRALIDREKERERGEGSYPPRAATSMANYQYLDRPDKQEFKVLKGHRSSYSLAVTTGGDTQGSPSLSGRRELPSDTRTVSAFGKYLQTSAGASPYLTASHLQDRQSTASPFGTRRISGNPTASTSAQSDHTRLMLESLNIFENTLSKLPQFADSSSSLRSSTAGDLANSAHTIVNAADRLYGVLKQGNARAMEAQVELEVESSSSGQKDPLVHDMVEMWGRVAADYREGSRSADEIIRSMTGLLLGMGRVLKEVMANHPDRSVSEWGSPLIHGRQLSVGDEEESKIVGGPGSGKEGTLRDSSSGRQSVASRHSWDTASKEREREDALRRLAGSNSGSSDRALVPRAESVLARASPATFQKYRELQTETPSPASRHRTATLPPLNTASANAGGGSVRRLFTPREQREQALDAKNRISSNGFKESAHPSPTPATRQLRDSPNLDRSKTLPPIAIPKPLPTLPSESAARRQQTRSSDDPQGSVRDRDRRRATIRGGERPVFPSITSPANPTTALTPHTVSNAPERSGFPLLRTDSGKSTRSQVTFSKPAAVSVQLTLSDQLNADGERKRTISTSSNTAEPSFNYPVSTMPQRSPLSLTSPLSSAENEKDAGGRKRVGTLGTKVSVRMSLDSQRDEIEERSGTGTSRLSQAHAADRSAASRLAPGPNSGKRERRRTVTDIWPRS